MIAADFVAADAEPPRELPSHGVYVINAVDLGPERFKVDGLLDSAGAIYLFEVGHPLNAQAVANIAANRLLVLIHAGASFRAWWQHLEKMHVLPKTLAASISGDPRRLDS